MPQKLGHKITAYELAIKLLSLKAHSSGELGEKLARKKYSSAEIESAIRELNVRRYLDDALYAQTYFENLKKYKIFGYFGIQRKLRQKKIPQHIIKETLENFSNNEEREIAKKLFRNNKPTDARKIARMLHSRGFRSEIISGFLNISEDF